MILLDIKKYIRQHQRVTLRDIQNHFELDEAAAIGLMEPLLQQGFIQEITSDNGPSCTTGRCSTNCHQVSKGSEFQWVDKPIKPLSIPVQII
ncbi:MAG: FeoC-like transcriptional regulator [Thiomicrorhabdus sp.]|nr:FeoC-like transcriptional regulator [Thiomicrorhabdus sp.]